MSMMANVRIFLWALLAVSLLLNYEAWVRDYPPLPAVGASQSNTPGVALDSTPVTAPPAVAATAPSANATAPVDAPPTVAGPVAAAANAEPAAAATAGNVHVVTDVMDLDISLAGGELRRADLLAYPLVKNQPQPVRLLSRDSAESLFVVQTGLAGVGDAAAPTHQAPFTSNSTELRLTDGQDELKVPLTWSNGQGVTVTKTYTLRRGRYQVDVEYRVDNQGTAPWSFASYAQLLRYNQPVETSYFRPETYSFKGPAYFDATKYQKLKLDDNDTKLDVSVTGGWVAGMQHHFVAAIVPKAGDAYRFLLRTQGNQYLISTTGPTQQVAPGASATQTETLFVGPKLQHQLEAAGPDLFRVADYGMLTILAQPLFWLMDKVHSWVSNWGVTIVIVTFLLKLLFYPLSEASGRSMAKMKNLAPRIKNLQETYKDQREKLGKAMMELYQREKVNPVAGCLPMVIQIPVFLAFYWVLLESVEMRQAPFMGWINDLSARDPFFILPLIMAVAMFIQYKLNPAPPDPVQAKVFMIMPLVMSVTFAFFPSGLVLYWVTNTVLSILQQWNINRRIEAQAARARS
jgi:YidC/Oxa1 family membrane protein insertase